MVRIDSVEREAQDGAPFGPGVKKALDLALSISRDMGFETVDLDGYIGYAFYGRGEDYVCAMGHVDVVPAGEGWKEPPFNGHMENGVIYSRGVLDNKGPVMACLYGLAAVRALGLPSGIRYASSSDVTRKRVLRISDTICQKKSLRLRIYAGLQISCGIQ